jgi:ribosomal protein L7Ae-like RNA K-turn-binding protein
MSVKLLKEAIENKKVLFGIKQSIKHKKDLDSVFVARDARDETVKILEKEKIDFSVLKSRKDLAKELNLDFLSEVFSIRK